jgi:hypothetical protein
MLSIQELSVSCECLLPGRLRALGIGPRHHTIPLSLLPSTGDELLSGAWNHWYLQVEHLSCLVLYCQCRTQYSVCSPYYLMHLRDIPTLSCLLPLETQTGGLCNNWEPTWPTEYKVLCSGFQYTKKGSFKSENSTEVNYWLLTSPALNPHITETHTLRTTRDFS